MEEKKKGKEKKRKIKKQKDKKKEREKLDESTDGQTGQLNLRRLVREDSRKESGQLRTTIPLLLFFSFSSFGSRRGGGCENDGELFSPEEVIGGI